MWTLVKSLNCNKYTFSNTGEDDITIAVKILKDEIFTLLYSEIVLHGENTTLEFDVDGVYIINIQDGDTELTYILPIYCDLQQCLINDLTADICACKGCKNCVDRDCRKLNELTANSQTFALLIGLITQNQTTDDISNYTYLNDLYLISDFIERFTDICASAKDCLECNGCK